MKYRVLVAVLVTLSISVSSLAQKPVPEAPQSPAPTPPPPVPGDEDVVRITANLVQVDAVVTDKKGQQVTDLSDQDFEVFEDGRPQKITNLSYVSLKSPTSEVRPPATTSTNYKFAPPVPVHLRPEQVNRTIALVVDDLGLSFESTVYVRQALKKFVDEQMRPGDLAAIVRTRAGTGALQQFTADKRLLYAAIDRLRWDPSGTGHLSAFAPISLDPLARLSSRAGDSIPGNAPAFGQGGNGDEQFRQDIFSVGTLGALKYVVQGMRSLPGRKCVVLMSDGITIFRPLTRESPGGSGDQGSSGGARQSRDEDTPRVVDALRKLTDFANRSSVVVYAMDARGLQTLGASAADNSNDMSTDAFEGAITDRNVAFLNSQDGLNYLARQTGGFFIHDTNDLAGGIAKALDDQKGYYLIGYRPDETTFDAAGHRNFHHLAVKVKRPGLKVRNRTGFYGVTDDEIRAVPRSSEQQMLEALLSPFSSGDVHLRLTSLFGRDAKGGSVMRALLHIDGRDLSFSELPDGWHQLSFEILAVTFGESGSIADKLGRTETMRVREDQYRLAQQQGLIYTINVPIQKAGAYQLRIAVRDTDSKRVGAASQFVEVPDLK
jgi:VWFA-related protein